MGSQLLGARRLVVVGSCHFEGVVFMLLCGYIRRYISAGVSTGLWMCALFVVGRRLWTPCPRCECVVINFACSLDTSSSAPNASRHDNL